jgi:predicted RNase H-like HicB family nuclease
MKQQIANYTVIIEKQKRLGINKDCYTAFAPTLGIATEDESIEQAKKAIQSLIQFHLESLAQEGETIPIETENALVTKSQVTLPANAILSA